MQALRALLCGCVIAGGVVASCAVTFEDFAVGDLNPDASSSGGASGVGGAAANGGSGGTLGGSAGVGGASGSAGTSGSSGAGGGSGGSAGAGGTAGSPSDASDAPAEACGTNGKMCGAECVQRDDPNHGCGGPNCANCAVSHGTAKCGVDEQCAVTCDANWNDCDSNPLTCESDGTADVNNCGTCGSRCTALAHAAGTCTAGQCEIVSCLGIWLDCDGFSSTGCESDPGNDSRHCGDCQTDCTNLGSNYVCSAGNCALNSCPAGRRDCTGTPGDCETYTASDVNNCGTCNNVCSLPNATAKCAGGLCAVDTCSTGFGNCDGNAANGCEADLRTNLNHCGECGRYCALNVASRSCTDGLCTSTCVAPAANCTQPPAPAADDGCELDVRYDSNNCGSCGHACSSMNASAAGCTLGSCDPTCLPGFKNCWNPVAPAADNGCEDISTDEDHCGACGRACNATQVATRQCTAGVCASTCNAGYDNCTKPIAPTPDNGCETHPADDKSHCGACGHACSQANASSVVCLAGSCAPMCSAGWQDCATPVAPASDNGCEVHTDADPNNCGACSRACSATQVATKRCTAGVCTSTCAAGYDNCQNPAAPNPDDGCELPTSADVNNCGGCGRACSATQVATRQCTAGLCTPTCGAGYEDCTEPVAPAADDGCEAHPIDDESNCGGCGHACSLGNASSVLCSGASCVPTCISGYQDCTTPVAPSADNGCEIHSDVDPNNCGTCGRVCSTTNVSTKLCSAGLCTSTCLAGYSNCAHPATPSADDGCEFASSADVFNCGGCARVCSGTNVSSMACVSSACKAYCDLGWSDCSWPSTENGCETAYSSSACGSCSNSCVTQMSGVCYSSGATYMCGCDADTDCRTGDTTATNTATCTIATGQCACPTVGTCRSGETCYKNTSTLLYSCQCNGSTACTGTQVCCYNPAGCKDLQTDITSCGACGRTCPTGFICSAAVCKCNAAADCNAGAAGTCNGSGQCVCTGVTCGPGERCRSDGTCG